MRGMGFNMSSSLLKVSVFCFSALAFLVMPSFVAQAQKFVRVQGAEAEALIAEEMAREEREAAEAAARGEDATLPIDRLPAEGAEVGEEEEILSEDPVLNDLLLRAKLKDPDVDTQQMASLFFTTWEQNLIADARNGFVARPPTEVEVEESEEEVVRGVRPTMGPRELALGGIVYVSSGEWTVWINGQKITPDRLPSEILDIRVQKDHVKLKWYDAYTNQIFPVKIKSHQRFNIDTRLFLPG